MHRTILSSALLVLSVALMTIASAISQAAPPAVTTKPATVRPAATRPTTAATTTPATTTAARLHDMLPLVDGSIRYLPPPGWEVLGKADDKLKISYRSPDLMARIDITVTPQQHELPDTAAAQMAMIIGKGIRDTAKKEHHDMIIPPRVDKDPRFLLKVHDRAREGEDHIVDRLQMYREVGLNLVYVAVVTIADSPEHCEVVAKEFSTVGEDVLDGVRLTRGATPVVFGRSQLKITTPIDWKLEKFDQPNGPVVTYSDPKDPSHEIIIRARILPKDARTDGTKRDAFIARMVEDERRLAPLNGASAGEEKPVSDAGSLRRIRILARRENDPIVVDTRYLIVADILVSIRTVSAESDEAIGKAADALVVTIKPARD